MKVIIDIVANHTAWDSVMMRHPGILQADGNGQIFRRGRLGGRGGARIITIRTARYMMDMLKHWVERVSIWTASDATWLAGADRIFGRRRGRN